MNFDGESDVPNGIPPQLWPLISGSYYPGTFSDFYGLPSHPISVYRTGDEWRVQRPESWGVPPREARPVCNHPIRDVWRTLGEKVYKFLDSLEVQWSTIDPVRFAEEGEEAGPLYLWVGVNLRSLSLEAAKAAAVGCKEIIAAAQFPDVEIAFRESVFTRSAGPKLLDHACSIHPTTDIRDIRSPFTGALGVQIASGNTPQFEGTGALYLCEGGQSDRVFLLTARHVLLPPRLHDNEAYEHKGTSQPRHEVLILGSEAYQDALKDIKAKIRLEGSSADLYERQLAALGEAVEGEARWQRFKGRLTKAEETIAAAEAFYSDITKNWGAESQRLLGHVVCAPPISVGTGPNHFTEDWAVIELNRDKIDWNNFKGNVVYIGTVRSILLRLCSLNIISRRQAFDPRLHLQDAPSPRGPFLLRLSVGRSPATQGCL